MEVTKESTPTTQQQKSYNTPRLIEHGSVETITAAVNIPMSRDAQMAGSRQGA